MVTRDKKRRDDWTRFTAMLLFGLFQWLLYFMRDSSELIIAVIPSPIAFLAAWYFSQEENKPRTPKNDFNPSGFIPKGLKYLTNRLIQSYIPTT